MSGVAKSPTKSLKVSNGYASKNKMLTNNSADEGKEDPNNHELIRKFSLGGDAWNKKSAQKKERKVSSAVKPVLEVDEDEDEGRGSTTDSPSDKDVDGSQADFEVSGDDSINVVVRVRPLNKSENEKKDSTTVQFPGDGVLYVNSNGSVKPFTFNVLFEPEASQRDVFEHSGVKKLVSMAVGGYACTCFAFGQTGSGKTHSITGPPQKLHSGKKLEESDYGLIPRSFHHLLELISEGDSKGISYTLKASYFELYNEQILDLLNVQGGKKLNLRWSANKGFYIENLFTIQCETFDDLMAVLEEGLTNRSTSAHNMNDFSSRSHSMLTINIQSEQKDESEENLYITKHGKLTFVDLAGSEKVKDTNTSGDQLLETNNINKSLLVLGKCISALGDPKKRNGHIPYRDSKLTKLLADSIGGNGVTLMIACVSPSKSNQGETMNTLRYATRTKKIKNKPVVKMDAREGFIMSLKKEIKVLKAENRLLREHAHLPSEVKSPHNPLSQEKTEGASTNGNKIKQAASMEPLDLENTDLYEMLQEYMIENETLRSENGEHLLGRERLKKEQQYIFIENDRLQRKVEELQRFILSGEHLPARSTHSTRQNSWHNNQAMVNSASSQNTLRSYHSVPDVNQLSYLTPPPHAFPSQSPLAYQQSAKLSLPPVKQKTAPPAFGPHGLSPSQVAYQNAYSSHLATPTSHLATPTSHLATPKMLKQQAVSPHPAQYHFNGQLVPPNTYTQKFELSKSLGARNAFQHVPAPHAGTSKPPLHSTSPQLPMKALPAPPAQINNAVILHGTPGGAYDKPPTHNKLPYRPPADYNGYSQPKTNTQLSINDQLKQELMVLDGEIRHTQKALTTTTTR